MKLLLITILSLFVLYGHGQITYPKSNDTIGYDVIVDKSDPLWCTSSQISLGDPVIGKDTITYDFMNNVKQLILSVKQPVNGGSYYIVSFRLKLNDENPQLVSGAEYDFNKLTQLKRGGELRILDCKVNCNGIVTLPDKLIIIKKGVN